MNGARTQELALPAAAFTALRHTLITELGAQRAAAVLRQAGHAAGDALFRALAQPRGATELGELEESEFWKRLTQLFASRGWGSLQHATPHPGLGALESPDWGEADPSSPARRPSCFFTTGLLANLLGQVAAADVAVLEVACRSRGDQQCRFLYGSPEALAAVYSRVAAGEQPEYAVAQLH
jgi:predicted hydrocarbon binding protein